MELQELLKMLRAHALVVIAATALGAVLAYAWTEAQTPVYTANASAVVRAGGSENVANAWQSENLSKSLSKSYVDIVRSRTVAEYVIEDLGLIGVSADSLVARIAISNPEDTSVLRVAATGASPEEARDLAEAWIAGMTQSIADLEADANGGRGVSVITLQTLDAAVLPSTPSFPNVKISVVLGGMLGFALGFAYALLRRSSDRRLRTSRNVEDAFEISVIGAVPLDVGLASGKNKSKKKQSSAVNTSMVEESLRQLRTNLQFLDIDNPPRIMVVTSALPGEGKSTVTIQLALVIAESGRNVILIDADLRRPRVADYLMLAGGVGLTDVLVGRAEVEEVLQPFGSTGRMHVMAAGSIPPNPSELLGSATMYRMLHGLDPEAIILIDSPPLIPVTDAALLTPQTDGALIVVRSGVTTIDILDRALRNLDRVKGHALGVILDGVSLKGEHSEHYGYTYDYRSQTHEGGRARDLLSRK